MLAESIVLSLDHSMFNFPWLVRHPEFLITFAKAVTVPHQQEVAT
jgi:hypothetical protein